MKPALSPANSTISSYFSRVSSMVMPMARQPRTMLREPDRSCVNAALMKDLSGSRNIVLGCLAMGMTMEETREKYDEIVEFAGLKAGFIDYPMSTYSSGMGARL